MGKGIEIGVYGYQNLLREGIYVRFVMFCKNKVVVKRGYVGELKRGDFNKGL